MSAFYGDVKVASLNDDIQYMTNSEYQAKKALGQLDASTYYATIPDGQKTEVIVTPIATIGNDVAKITVDGVETTIKSGITLSDVAATGNNVATITIGGTPTTLKSGVEANSATADGIVTKGQGQASKAWATDASGNPGWRDMPAASIVWEDIYVRSTPATTTHAYITLSKNFTDYKMLMIEAHWTSGTYTLYCSGMISVNALNSTSGSNAGPANAMLFSAGDASVAEWEWKSASDGNRVIYRACQGTSGLTAPALTIDHVYGIK